VSNTTAPLKLISTDFDGTIFAEFEQPPIAAQLVTLLAAQQARGVKWIINTGRDMSGLMEALGRAQLPIQPDGLVLVEREIHFRHGARYVPHATWNAASDAAHAEIFRRMHRDLPRLRRWASENHRAMIYEDSYSPFCMIARDNTEADAIHAYLDEYCRDQPDLCVVRNDVYARIAHAGFNKGSALAEVARHWKISPENILAAGDHLNDLPMLNRTYAHHLVTNANAVPSVKETVRAQNGFISSLPCGHGVAEGILHFA
jgi:HAD superfamily hydrolase (TIGR01484 family)